MTRATRATASVPDACPAPVRLDSLRLKRPVTRHPATTPPAAQLPRSTVPRLARPRWLDPRLLLGVLLVLVSVVVGARIVAEADDSYPVWGLRRDLGAGSTLGADDLVARRVRLDGDSGVYLAATDSPPVGWVLTRPVSAGELVPRAALARPDALATRRVAVPVSAVTAADLVEGAVVDVYVIPRAASGAGVAAAPVAVQRVVSGVTVAKVERSGRGLTGSSTASVVLVLRSAGAAAGASDEVAALLSAQARGEIQLVHVPQAMP